PIRNAWHPSPASAFRPYSIGGVCLTSMLMGWWLYCGMAIFAAFVFMSVGQPYSAELAQKLFDRDKLLSFLVGFGFVCACLRLAVYCLTRWPPLGCFGRISTGRLIIPGYDKVFIAPIIIVFIGCQLPNMLVGLGVPLSIEVCLTFSATLLASFGLPPTLE